MITERMALIMLEGEATHEGRDPHCTKRFYHSIQTFADYSLQLCEAGNTKKFEEHLRVAFRMFKEGNATVKNAIVNVYLFTITHALDKQRELIAYAKQVFPKELMSEYQRLQLAGGL